MKIRIRKGRVRKIAGLGVRGVMLIIVSIAILLTLFSLMATSLKDVYGLVDPMVKWVPREWHWENYELAFDALGGTQSLITSLLLYLAVTVSQVISSAVIGYGFSRYGFRGRKIVFACLVATFFVPQQVLMLPRYVLFSRYGMLGTAWTMVLPSILGQGMKQALLILIFWQFLRSIPASLEEAAMIDGASLPGIFFRIGVPLAMPGVVISAVLSFSWNWNDTYFASTYFKGKIRTMTLALSTMREYYASQSGLSSSFGAKELFHQGVEAAAVMLVILPLLLLYLLLERRLIESVDRVGITGE